MMKCALAAGLVGLLALAASAPPAAAQTTPPPPPATPRQPNAGYLVLAGAGMALPTYVLNLTIHEGSHALTALSFGSEVERFSIIPGFYDGHFYFGYVRYRGRMTRAQRTFFLLAPKVPDVLALSTYAALVGTNTLPPSAYARMALAVVATGFWVDFSKDLVAVWSPPDVTRALRLNGFDTFVKRLPWHALHLALSGAGVYLLVRGYQGVFSPSTSSTTTAIRSAPLRGPPVGFTLLNGAF
jgi:hypothetical protein